MINKLPLNLSVYLNSLRILSVFAVILVSAQVIFKLQIFPAAHLFGNEAVVIVFVISGFLTQYTFKEHRTDRRSFTIARASRVYSAAFVVALICLGVDFVASSGRPAYYQSLAQTGLYSPLDLFGLVHYLTFTHEAWIWHTQLGSMTTYWSLGYIVMFYVFFGFTAFRKRRMRVLVGIWLLIVGPQIALYLTLWLLGVETYKYVKKYRQGLSFDLAIYIFIFSVFAFLGATVFIGPILASPMQHSSAIMDTLVGYLYHLAIAILVALNLISFERLFRYAPVPSVEVEAAVQWLAGANLTLYLLHPTLMMAAVAFYPKLTKDPVLAAGAVVAIILACLLTAEFGERRRKHFASFINKLLR